MVTAAGPLRKQKDEAERRLPASPVPKPPPSKARASNPARSGILPMGPTSSGVVDVTSSTFEPSQTIADEIAASDGKGLDVRVIAKGITQEGIIKVRQDPRKRFQSRGRGSMPLLNPWTQSLGGMYLNFEITNSAVKNGLASFTAGGRDKNDWLTALKKDSTALGGLGLKVQNLPAPINKFENGILALGVSGLKVGVGGYVDAVFDLQLENMNAPQITGAAQIDVKGAAKGELKIENKGGQLKGSVSLATTFKSFSGAVTVSYLADGTVDISGKAAYSADKLSGEIQFVATDEATANRFTKDAIAAAGGKENIQNAGAPAPVPVAKEGQKKRALAAVGTLNFNLTKWFAGTVNVVVDGKGAITVIGKIAPPGEITLFKQRDWDKQLVKFEAKAYYGIPVVGNLNLFANISLNAIAKLGPAKLYNIEILGTYSTDPEVQKSIQISASINISAYAGLRLRAEGGAGIEILDHDLKFGVGLQADIGVMAYADARPTIGYREPGEFYISGTLEMVAQPMLGLGGDFFIELDTPWWSPLSDDRWTWPLFSKEWPLTDPIGLSATVKDYVLGSGAVPEIEFKKPEFDPSKFMTNMVDDKLPNKSGKGGDGKGAFKEDGSVKKPVIEAKKNKAKAQPDTKGKKKGGGVTTGKSGKPNADAAKGAASSKQLQLAAKKLNALKGKGPLARGDLDKELAAIKSQVGGINLVVTEKGTKWLVTPKAGGKIKKGKEKTTGVEIGRKDSKLADGELGETVRFNAEDGGHRLWIDVKGANAELMMASTVKPLSAHLVDFKKMASSLDNSAKATVVAAISKAGPLAKSIEKNIKKAIKKDIGTSERDAIDTQIEKDQASLAPILKSILDELGIKVPDATDPINIIFVRNPKLDMGEYDRQLSGQAAGINGMSVEIWMSRRAEYAALKMQNKANTGKASGRDPRSAKAQKEALVAYKKLLVQRLGEPEQSQSATTALVDKDPFLKGIVTAVFGSFSASTRSKGIAASTAENALEPWFGPRGVATEKVAALHEPDQVVGGRQRDAAKGIAGLGLSDVNSDIGANWGGLSFGGPSRQPLAKNLEKTVKDFMKKKKVAKAFWLKVRMNVNLK